MNTTYFINQIMGNVFRTKTTPALATQYYLGLSTSEPTVSGVCKGEPTRGTSTGYDRVLLESLSAPEDGIITNTVPITFNESVTDWGSITHYVVYDAKTGGNLLFYGDLAISRSVEPGTTITVKTGELKIQLYSAEA